ncbi:aspartyl/glutamyl-tRNA amidotransferase subunit C [Mycoplasma sp. OR1901]|uniref:Asp-tRNA(Asn)/Glu-tRNA(Gln) amidotransferase subunit GatC n=1 Tax=Mycoplasma sp. OR1901 TaxID=2742195 RepID=UPI00158340C1|nr:Asp-tRNA(Asn)/Glu-tRNA(Gln) amidotransferase subunit GatC [Mycoplasma sp. OR1901]QKT05362.1 glutamyl-tRNA amidotransferase [Mycoplasma sp. OR1901]
MTVNKEKIKEIVNSLMFNPSDEVLDHIIENWHELENELKSFDKLDLDKVKPLSHINEEYKIDLLRDDEFDNEFKSINKSQILSNAATSDDDYVTIKKVVK